MLSLSINIILILLAAVGFVVQIASVLFDEHKRNKPFLKRFSATGKWGLAVAFLMFIGGSASIFVNQGDKRETFISDSVKYQKLNDRFDSLKNSFFDGLRQTRDSMSFQFGLGVKKGDTNTHAIILDALYNKNELEDKVALLQAKLDSCKGGRPAEIGFIDEPTNCLRITKTKDSIFIFSDFKNTGEFTAYSALIRTHIIITIANAGSYELMDNLQDNIQSNLTAGTDRFCYDQFYMPDAIYKGLTYITCVADGYYFYNATSKDTIKYIVAKTYDVEKNRNGNYPFTTPLDSLLRTIKHIYPSKK